MAQRVGRGIALLFFHGELILKGKAIPLQDRCGPEGG